MEALVELHDNIMFYLVIILFGVAWILVSIIRNYVYSKSPISNKYLNHGTLIELIWTITPALILILIAFPSFKLLYLMDEVTDPSLTVFVEGHQWYWSYQYPDFLSNDDEALEFDSYLVPDSDLEDGGLRLLEVDNRGMLLTEEVSGNNANESESLPIMDFNTPGNRIMDVSYTTYRNRTGQASPNLLFIYDTWDPSATDLNTLFQGTTIHSAQQGNHRGFVFKVGTFNFDRNSDVAKAKVVTSQFNFIKDTMHNRVMSGGQDISTSAPIGTTGLTNLHIVRANPNFAP
jgi:heme/copper-type cytochrome/quinol oxidase subunit 2